MDSPALILLIEEHSAATGLEPSTICLYALGNSRLYARLKAGGECLPRTASKLAGWVEADAQQRASAENAA